MCVNSHTLCIIGILCLGLELKTLLSHQLCSVKQTLDLCKSNKIS